MDNLNLYVPLVNLKKKESTCPKTIICVVCIKEKTVPSIVRNSIHVSWFSVCCTFDLNRNTKTSLRYSVLVLFVLFNILH